MQEEVPTSKVGDEFRPTQKHKSPKIKSVKLQQRKHEVIKKYIIIIIYYRTTATIGEKRGESHGKQGIQEYIQGAHGASSLMLSTVVLSNENRLFATLLRKEVPTSLGGEDVTKFLIK